MTSSQLINQIHLYKDLHIASKLYTMSRSSEAATQRSSYEEVFRRYAADLQENTHAEVRFK